MMALSFRDLSERARLRLAGPDRKRYLHGMVTNDIQRLLPGQGCHAAMLTVKGKLLGDMIVLDCGEEEGLLLLMEAAARDKVRQDLERHLILDDATVSDVSGELHELGVYGEQAQAALSELLGSTLELAEAYAHVAVPGVRVLRGRELGVPEYRLLAPPGLLHELPARLAALGGRPLPEAEAEILRIEAGTPRYGLDMDEERLPIEANLEDAVSFTKGCYLGQEVVARVSLRGHVNRKLVGLRFPGLDAPPPRGTQLQHETRENAGTVMSGARSPRHGAIALGYVHRTLWDPGTRLRLPGGGEAVVGGLPFSA
jgi:folate-binding protein YgfZ